MQNATAPCDTITKYTQANQGCVVDVTTLQALTKVGSAYL